MEEIIRRILEAAATGWAGDQVMERTGLGKRAEGILDKIIPPAAASDASAIPQDLVPADVVMTPAQEQQVMHNADMYNGVPYRESGEPVGANALLPDTAREPQVTQMRPTQLPDISMQETADDRANKIQDFVRNAAVGTQQLLKEVPEEVQADPQAQKGAAALSTAYLLKAKAMADNERAQMTGELPSEERDVETDNFLSNIFGSEEFMLSLALGFNSMRLNPDQGLAASLGKRLETINARKTATFTANKTIQSLKAIGTPIALKYAAMIEANPSMAKEIYKEYVKSSGTGFDKDIVKGESDLRKEFTGLPTVKDFQSQSTAFGRVVASAKDPSAAGDLALIFNYMKVLDPGSTVREGEFATAQNASGVPGRVASLYNNILRGERLNPEQRSDFVDRARRLYMAAASSYEGIRDDYTDIARQYNFDVERTVPDLFAQKKDIVDPPKPSYSSLPESVKSKYSADQFDAMWNGMSYLTKLQLSGV